MRTFIDYEGFDINDINLRLVKHEGNSYEFEAKTDPGYESSIVFITLPNGLNILTGAYGTITYRRKYFESDPFFPSDDDHFNYWLSKIEKHMSHLCLKEFSIDKAKEEIRRMIDEDISICENEYGVSLENQFKRQIEDFFDNLWDYDLEYSFDVLNIVWALEFEKLLNDFGNVFNDLVWEILPRQLTEYFQKDSFDVIKKAVRVQYELLLQITELIKGDDEKNV